MRKYKTNEHQVKGECQVCKNVNHTSIWVICLQEGWFRGDDISLGKFCKKCKTKENIKKRINEIKQGDPERSEGEEKKS